MVRAPCCEKMGLKKGPWTPEEDQVLVSYIQKNGHGNWRALPKQAGLLRCGKSCRLRWTNYLRPDIKRGNFTKEEEDSIIELHEMLGNRWSAIASKLPGRTDNEIKNVWHTHLKKKLKNYEPSQDTKRQKKSADDANKSPSDDVHDESDQSSGAGENDDSAPVSPHPSSSEVSTVTDSAGSGEGSTVIKQEETNSFEFECDIPQIDESFWSEELSMESDDQMQLHLPESNMAAQDDFTCTTKIDDGMDFWYDLFIRAGELPDLPEF